MMRPLRTLVASIKRLRGARPRDVQECADLHRLYLFSRLCEENGGVGGSSSAPGGGGGSVDASFADRVVAEASGLSDEDRREAVARALRRQALGLARAVHVALEKDAGDPAPAAAALREWSRRRRAEGQSLDAKPMSRPGDESDDDDDDDDDAGGGGSDSDGREGDESYGGGGKKQQRQKQEGGASAASSAGATAASAASAQALARLAARRVGFGLRVGPSAVGHHDAGLGLFVTASGDEPQQGQRQQRGAGGLGGRPKNAPAVPAGALIAFFPGLCYTRADFRRMAGYPKVDRGNPYLAARYDGVVIDSQPWARGDGAAPGGGEAGDGSSSSSSSGGRSSSSGGSSGSGSTSAASLGLDAFRPPRRPVPRNLLARMARASDRPRLPPAAAAALDRAAAARQAALARRGGWCSPTTDEAAALELGLPLEPRHPYALAHFANHPPPGQQPNAMIAPIDFAPGAFAGGGGDDEDEDGDRDGDRGDGRGGGAPRLPAELRAYLPFAPYEAAAALTVWPVERALKARGEEAAVAAANRFARMAAAAADGLWRRGSSELALRAAHGLGLVALRPLAEGEEIVFDYRLSPGMLGRPVWYEPCDEAAEDRRWA